ncbi:GyrI-like domain-containing protein [uncultured Christiangramia sp.]|uniref:GyrI-like domain-containing protein n=1 Tax=Christiangramia sp. 3-2217-3z TaxID=3417564 RepID=UPI0026205F25|nr:GyrI-like domain-containing protein [uncultured Christiangramia sp.]
MIKKYFTILLGVLLLSLAWFLFIKEYDYQFRFQANHSPAMVQQELKKIESYSIFDGEPIVSNQQTEGYEALKQTLQFGDQELELLWELENQADTVTSISVNVTSNEKIQNRLAILNPFAESGYIDSLENSFLQFGKELLKKQAAYKVQVVDSIVYSPALDCICKPAADIKVENKAMQMVRDIGYLEDFQISHKLKLTGYPFVKIQDWDQEAGTIDYDFCFPVNLAQDIRPNTFIEFQQFPATTSLKAIYNGNYRSSDLAWHQLLSEAKKRDLKTSNLPLEIFWNNPKTGGEALSWKAEIFMPVEPES